MKQSSSPLSDRALEMLMRDVLDVVLEELALDMALNAGPADCELLHLEPRKSGRHKKHPTPSGPAEIVDLFAYRKAVGDQGRS